MAVVSPSSCQLLSYALYPHILLLISSPTPSALLTSHRHSRFMQLISCLRKSCSGTCLPSFRIGKNAAYHHSRMSIDITPLAQSATSLLKNTGRLRRFGETLPSKSSELVDGLSRRKTGRLAISVGNKQSQSKSRAHESTHNHCLPPLFSHLLPFQEEAIPTLYFSIGLDGIQMTYLNRRLYFTMHI